MNLWLSLDKDFERLFVKLEKEEKEHMKLEGLTTDKLDPTRFFKGFLNSGNVADASIDPNSNVNSQNITTLLHEMSKPMQKLLSLNKLYIELKEEYDKDTADKAIKGHIVGDIYIHDLSGFSYKPYCYAYSLKSIAEKGLYFINEMKANAPKHLDTFNSHIMETIAFLTNLQDGAVGVPDYLLYSFYFWNKDKNEGYIDSDKAEIYKKQQFQKMIFELNQPFLKINQSAYTNFSIMDREYYVGLFGGLSFPNGDLAIDYIEDFMKYQKDFLEYINELREEKGFTFPVLTFSAIFKDGEWQDEDMAKFAVRHNMKWGDTNMYVSDNADVLSSCCRMTNSLTDIKENKVEKLEGNFNSTGGTDLNIGSTKAITINLPRVAFRAKGDFKRAKEITKELVDLIHKIHFIHREKILQKNIERGLLPQYTYKLMNMEKQFATVGVVGLQEFVEFFGGISKNNIGELFYSDKGIKVVSEILDYITKLNNITLNTYGYTSNIEEIPAENASPTLLKKDRLVFRNFPMKNKIAYANQWCALDENFALNERIKLSGLLDNKMGGGAILHLNLGESWSSFEDAWKFNTYVASQGVKYWSEIRKFQYCENDHNFFGKTCPICGGEAKGDIIKVVGYLVKNEYYQKERREEMDSRIFYDLKK